MCMCHKTHTIQGWHLFVFIRSPLAFAYVVHLVLKMGFPAKYFKFPISALHDFPCRNVIIITRMSVSAHHLHHSALSHCLPSHLVYI